MAIGSFNGDFIFGAAAAVVPGDPTRDYQQNFYPGVPGAEELDSAERTLQFEATGWLEGDGEAGLFAAEQLFRSYRDGNAYTLFDTLGGEWTNVVCRSFAPQGESKLGSDGICCRQYRATFEKIG